MTCRIHFIDGSEKEIIGSDGSEFETIRKNIESKDDVTWVHNSRLLFNMQHVIWIERHKDNKAK